MSISPRASISSSSGVFTDSSSMIGWTSCFFGGLPAILRGDVAVGLVVLAAWVCTLGLAGVLWGFVYNKRYTLGLLRQGYQFCGHPWEVEEAMYALGLSSEAPRGRWGRG